MTPLASFSGLATGLDTATLITELVRAESIPITRLRAKQDNHNSMSARFSTIRDRLDTLKIASEDIGGGGPPTSITSSDEDAITATPTGGATNGTYRIEVSQLARAERSHSVGLADADAALAPGGGSLEFQVGTDAAVSIAIDASDSLSTLATKINDADAGVTASVIYDGSDYRLQVNGDESGLENAISFTETGVALGMSETVSAADAEFTVDGLAMTRSTNSVSSAIPGVTMELTTETSGPVSITIGSDSSALVEQLQTFVDAYNAVSSGINIESIFSGEPRTGDSLAGDSSLRSLQRAMSSAVLGAVPGAIESLSTLGIETDRNGSMTFDAEAFSSALADDPDAVMLALRGDDTEQGLLSRMEDMVDVYAEKDTGLISQRIDGFEDLNRDIDDRIINMEVRIEKFETNMRQKFASLETLVAGLNAQGDQMLAILGGLG